MHQTLFPVFYRLWLEKHNIIVRRRIVQKNRHQNLSKYNTNNPNKNMSSNVIFAKKYVSGFIQTCY